MRASSRRSAQRHRDADRAVLVPTDDVIVWVKVTVPTITPPFKAPEKLIASELFWALMVPLSVAVTDWQPPVLGGL